MRPPTISTKSCPPRHIPSIEKCIEELGERFNIREIAFDRWGAVSLKGLALRRDGAEPRRNGLHRCPLRTGFRQYESSHQGIDEAGLGAENRPPSLRYGCEPLRDKSLRGSSTAGIQFCGGTWTTSSFAPTLPGTSRQTKQKARRRLTGRLLSSWLLTVRFVVGM